MLRPGSDGDCFAVSTLNELGQRRSVNFFVKQLMPVTAPTDPALRAKTVLCTIFVLLLCGLYCGTDIAFAKTQTFVTQSAGLLGVVGLLLAFIAGVVYAISNWKQLRFWAFLPLLVCLGSCQGSTTIARAARKAQFERDIPRYQAVIAKIEGGAISLPAQGEPIRLSGVEQDLAYSVLAQRDTNGLVTVEFLTGGGFPLKHSGYLYSSSGAIQRGSLFDSRWPLRTEIKPKWFRISD